MNEDSSPKGFLGAEDILPIKKISEQKGHMTPSHSIRSVCLDLVCFCGVLINGKWGQLKKELNKT